MKTSSASQVGKDPGGGEKGKPLADDCQEAKEALTDREAAHLPSPGVNARLGQPGFQRPST